MENTKHCYHTEKRLDHQTDAPINSYLVEMSHVLECGYGNVSWVFALTRAITDVLSMYFFSNFTKRGSDVV